MKGNLKNLIWMNKKNLMNYSNNICKKWMKNNKLQKKINKIQLKGLKIKQRNQKIQYPNIKLQVKIYNFKSLSFTIIF